MTRSLTNYSFAIKSNVYFVSCGMRVMFDSTRSVGVLVLNLNLIVYLIRKSSKTLIYKEVYLSYLPEKKGLF